MLSVKAIEDIQKIKYGLSIIKFDEKEKWNNFVKSFENYDVYYLHDYVKAFKIHGDGEPMLFYYQDENIKAINVVMKRDISLDRRFTGNIPPNTLYDLATPYGYGGFLIEGKITEQSLKALENQYTTLCKKERIISEFVRFHPVLNNGEELKGFYDISTLGKTITMNLFSEYQIWNDLTSKNRNVIRKARKSGVEIFWGRKIELFDKFIDLYNSTMDRDSAEEYYYFEKEFYNSVLYDMKYNTMMFYAVFQQQIIAMSIVMFGNQQMHYHLSASNREYQQFAPTNLLLYEVACWGLENGYKTFHLGGGLGSKEDNLFNFKKAFNKNSNSKFSIGRKIFDLEVYDKLVSIRKNNKNFNSHNTFFPLYRA